MGRRAGWLGWGLGLCVLGGFLQGAAAGEKPAAGPIHVTIRPPEVTPVPPAPAREPVLVPVALEPQGAAARPTKIAQVRAYARDGASFYQNGQLILIQGLDAAALGGEHAKQRLQQLLDGGQVSVLPVGESAGGGMVAVVQVNGRDVAQAMASN